METNCPSQHSRETLDKLIAKELQAKTHLFHNLQYGPLVGRSAIDAMMLTLSTAEREIARGNRVTLLGKDIVSAFNNIRSETLLEILVANNVREETIEYIRRFLAPRSFNIGWDMKIRGRGRGHMHQGAPQGSPLSPVLWLIYIANTLKRVTISLALAPFPTMQSRSVSLPRRTAPRPPPSATTDIYSYVDDINPLNITTDSTHQEHERMVQKVNQLLIQEAGKDGLEFEAQNDSRVDFGHVHSKSKAKTLGIIVTGNLSPREHIRERTRKASQRAQVLYRLGNSNGGMSPAAMRTLYTSAIRPIFTDGSEIDDCQDPKVYNTFYFFIFLF